MYKLTDDDFDKIGYIWHQVAHNLTEPLTVSGQLNFGAEDGGADGICFVMQDQCAAGSGVAVGGGIGYSGMKGKSIAVEFDTYQNTNNAASNQDNHDPEYDHVAIVQMGNPDHGNLLNTGFPTPIPISADPSNLNVEDGNWYDFKIIITPSSIPTTIRLQVYFDNAQRIDQTVTNIFTDNPYVFWGFSSSTGGSKNRQLVLIDSTSSSVLKDTTVCLTETPSIQVFLPSLEGIFKGKNIALNRPTVVSSIEGNDNATYSGNFAVDDDNLNTSPTRWSSNVSNNEWIYVDLGYEFDVDSVVIRWQESYAQGYKIQFSTDGTNWLDNGQVYVGQFGVDIRPTTGPGTQGARYVRILCITPPSNGYGNSIYNIRVLGSANYTWSPDNGTIDDIHSASPTFTPVLTDPDNTVQSFAYTVTIPDPCLSQSIQSFTIINNCALPVTFLSFEVLDHTKSRELKWATMDEQHAANFSIEKSIDGTNFSWIGTLPASNKAGTHMYSFTDGSALNGTAYYRIVQYDLNGSANIYSNIQAITHVSREVFLYPNPTSGFLTVKTSMEGKIEYQVFNAIGQSVFYNVAEGAEYTIDLSAFVSGTYTLMITGTSNRFIKQLIKQ